MSDSRKIVIDTSAHALSVNSHDKAEIGMEGVPGLDGLNAQNIRIALSFQSGSLHIVYNDAQPITLEPTIPCSIFLTANGGHATRGGDGGDGHPGENGMSGADATEQMPGQPGTNGTDGANGMDGGSGGHGGHAGDITVCVNEVDADLLCLIEEIEQKGGRHGEGGQPGQGGPGGLGGPGGIYYSWRPDSCHPAPHNISHLETWAMGGGTHGLPGMQGNRGVLGMAGKDGRNGRTTFILQDERGELGYSTMYSRSYQLQIEGFVVETSNDGINEPGETLAVKNIALKNVGNMSTPVQHPFIITGISNDWISFDETGLPIRDPILPGQCCVLPGRLLFKIKDTAIIADNHPLNIDTAITLVARSPRLNKVITVSESKILKIQHPVTLTVFCDKQAMIQDETPPIVLAIKNCSMRAIDARLFRVELTADHHSVFIQNVTGEKSEISSQCFEWQQSLPAHELVVMSSGTLDLSRLCLPNSYTTVRLTAILSVGEWVDSSSLRAIQKQTVNLHVAEPYQYHSDALVTLIVDEDIDAKVIESWTHRLKNVFGSHVNVCDISLYGGINYFFHHQPTSTRQSLTQSFAGKIVVIFDNLFSDEGHHARRATHYLNSTDIFSWAQQHHVRTYVIGNDFKLKEALMPELPQAIARYATTKALIRALRVGRNDDGYQLSVTCPRQSSDQQNRMTIQKQANRLEKTLIKKFPEKRFFTFFSYHVVQHAGLIEVRAGLDVNKAHVIYKNTTDYHGKGIDIYNLFKLMPFVLKLNKVPSYLNKQEEVALLKAILSDLADEQIAMRRVSLNGVFSKIQLRSHLSHLMYLTSFNFEQILQNDHGKIFLKKLFFQLSCFVNKSPSGSGAFFTMNPNRNVIAVCNQAIHAWMKKHKQALGSTDQSIRQDIQYYNHLYADLDPVELQAKFARPYLTESVMQDNWIPVDPALDIHTLPEILSAVVDAPVHQDHFSNEAERLDAIYQAEKRVGGLVL